MAAKEELKHLTCSICLEILREPKVLPCLHRFCESCLDNHIQISSDYNRSGFLCPVCKTFTTAPDMAGTRSTWAALFKTDFIVKELISSRLGEPSRFKHPCPTHMDVECDYYCFDCSQIMCHRCALASHRRCEEVMTLPEAANQRKAPLEAAIHETSSQLKGREQSQRLFNEYHQLINDNASRLEARIQRWSQERQKSVKDYEEELLERLGKVCTDLKEKVQSQVKNVQKAEDQVQCRIEAAVVKMSSSDADILLENFVDDAIQSCHQRDLDGAVENMQRNCNNICNVNIDFQEFHDASRINGGGLRIEYAYGTSQDSTNHLQIKTLSMPDNIQVLKTILVGGLTSFLFSVGIQGMIVVGPDNTIIMTNYNNKCITTLSNSGEACMTLTLPGGPSGITQISETLVAVSLSDLRQIYVIEVSQRLRVTSCVQYTASYWALATLSSSTLVAASSRSPCIDIINLHGQVLKSLRVNTASSSEVGTFPSICVTPDKRILFSDERSKSLVCISQDGEIQFKYTSLQSPRGVACDSCGIIGLLGDKELISLTPDGRFIKTLVRCEDVGLYSLRCLAVDIAGLVYVTDGIGNLKILKIT